MKKIPLLAAAIFGAAAAQAQSIYSSPDSPPAAMPYGTAAYNAPVDANAAPNYYYFYDNNPPTGPDNYIGWYGTGLTPGKLYRVAISWAAHPAHNNLATFRMDYDGNSGWDFVNDFNQQLMADGSAPANAPNWSGWKDVGTIRAAGTDVAFAWDFTNNPDTNLAISTGTVRLTLVDDVYSPPLNPPASSAWGAYFTGTPSDANATPNYYYFYNGYIVWGSGVASLTVGQQYQVDVSWAANPGHNSLATFRLELNDTNAVDSAFWDYMFTIDQSKLADGSEPTAPPQWSGWKNIGTFTATHDSATFAWDFTAGYTGPNTTGTIRIRQVGTEALPTLSIAKLGSDIVLSWPSPSTGFVLKENSDLSPGNWTAVTATINDNGTTKSVTIPSPTGKNFYRLEK